MDTRLAILLGASALLVVSIVYFVVSLLRARAPRLPAPGPGVAVPDAADTSASDSLRTPLDLGHWAPEPQEKEWASSPADVDVAPSWSGSDEPAAPAAVGVEAAPHADEPLLESSAVENAVLPEVPPVDIDELDVAVAELAVRAHDARPMVAQPAVAGPGLPPVDEVRLWTPESGPSAVVADEPPLPELSDMYPPVEPLPAPAQLAPLAAAPDPAPDRVWAWTPMEPEPGPEPEPEPEPEPDTKREPAPAPEPPTGLLALEQALGMGIEPEATLEPAPTPGAPASPAAPSVPEPAERVLPPDYHMIAPVEISFREGGQRVGIRPGTATFLKYQRLAAVLLNDLKRARQS